MRKSSPKAGNWLSQEHTAEAEIQTWVWDSWLYFFSNLPGYFRSSKTFLCSYTWNNINLLKDMQG